MKWVLIGGALFGLSCLFALAVAYWMGQCDDQDQKAREKWAKEHQRPW